MQVSLQEHDRERLHTALGQLSPNQSVSIEGEPLYADQEWGNLHQFAYNFVLPEIASYYPCFIDLLFDEYTTSESNFDLEVFLAQIYLNLPMNVITESELVSDAEKIIETLRTQGQIISRNQLLFIETNSGNREVALTTHSGRIACTTLDAAYQQRKSLLVDTTILVHSMDFKRQQQEMLTVLQAFNNGRMPFEAFLNIFTRTRKGQTRLASIWLTDAEGKLENID